MKNRIPSAIAFATVLTALYLAAPFLPRSLTWGFHFLAFLGPAATVAFLAGVLLLFAAALSRRTGPAISRVAAAAQSRRFLLPGCALGAFLLAGFIFRVRVPLLGDSWFLVRNFASAIRGTDAILPRDEPLATYYFSTLTHLFGVNSYPGFLDAFFAGDMLLGAGFILAAWGTTRAVFPGGVERVLSLFVVCTLPAMLLFFGYVETYSVVLMVLSLYVLAGVLYLRRRLHFAFVALAFLLQILTHYLTVLTLPSLAYLVYAGWKRGDSRQLAAGAAAFAAAALIALASVGFNVENYFSQVPHKHYLPLVTPGDVDERYSSPYTLFSPYHFGDLANLALLLAGAASLLLLAAFVPAAPGPGDPSKAPAGGADIGRFLSGSWVPILLFALVAKFDLGAARDWDVIAPYSYILTLFALTVHFRRVPAAEDPRPALIAGGTGLACTLLWLTVNASPTASVERFIGLLDPAVTGQGGMYSGTLYLSRYYAQARKGEDQSAALWERYIDLYPGDLRGYRNVVANMRGASAVEVTGAFNDWFSRFGDNPVTRAAVVGLSLESGNGSLEQDRLGDARVYFSATVAADSGSAAGWNNLGIVHAREGDFREAAVMFTRAVEIDTAFADAWFNLGRTRIALGDETGGRAAFALSARFGNEAARKMLAGSGGR